jgi:gas vesicle protein
VKKIIVGMVIASVALFLFWPESKTQNKTDYNYALLIEIREQNNILREQTDLLKRVIQGQASQEIDLSAMSAYLKDIESDLKYK